MTAALFSGKQKQHEYLGGGFKYVLFSPQKLGKMNPI